MSYSLTPVLQEGECEEGDGEAEVEVEVEVEGDVMEEETDEDLDEEENPAVIVEEVPGRGLEQYFSAQVLVYEDGTYLIQDVGEEQEVETEVVETGERPGWDVHTGLGLHISYTIYHLPTQPEYTSGIYIQYQSNVWTHLLVFLYLYYHLHCRIIVKTSQLCNNTYGIM